MAKESGLNVATPSFQIPINPVLPLAKEFLDCQVIEGHAKERPKEGKNQGIEQKAGNCQGIEAKGKFNFLKENCVFV